MIKKSILLLLHILPLVGFSQATITINSIPGYYTPLLDTIFISGTFNSWDPRDPVYRMIPNTNGTYSIDVNATSGSTVEYKFTRGTWTNVETDINGIDISNRSFSFSNGMQLYDTIANWKDMAGLHTAVGNTKILDLDFAIPQLGRYRRVWVCLPTDYYTSGINYPVLYMQDGQNLFDELYCFSGEWGIDESMDSLASVFSPKAIVIGIDNGGTNRINEYSPWVDATYGGGEGDEYVSFICSTLKPFIDSHFRTLPDRENTGIMGSSMGGFISFYGAIKHQDIFGKAGIFSPSFWFSDSIYDFISLQGHQQDMKIYFMCGNLESGSMVSDMQNVYDSLLLHGFSAGEMNFQTRADGQHSEWFWRREYPSAFAWLFASTITGNENINTGNNIRIFPQPASTVINITTQQNDVIEIYNIEGQLMKSITAGENYTTIDISGFARGMYVVKVKSSAIYKVGKFVKE